MSDPTNLPAKRDSYFDDAVLREIDDWNSLGAYVQKSDILVENLSAYGPGTVVVTDKRILVGVPLMILSYRFHEGDKGTFVSAVAVTKNPVTIEGRDTSKIVINDGSTGILAQLMTIESERVKSGTDVIRPLYCPAGLRESTYERKDENGAPILNDRGRPEMGTTYYLS